MLKVHFPIGRLAFILGVLLLVSGGVSAQTNQTVTLGPNVGTFSYTVSSDFYDCNDGRYSYTEYDFSNMSYTSVDGVQHSLGDGTYFIKGGGTYCPPSSAGPTITDNEATYTLVIVPRAGSLAVTVSVPGYVNPKYMVVGVVYAPPGHVSFVDYSTSNLVSTTVSTKSTFSTGYTQGNTFMYTQTLKPWKNGEIDSSAKDSTSYTNTTTTTDSTAVTVQQVTGLTRKYPGPTCDYCGVDHDYDQILVWLNPVELYTLTNNGVVQANGYGYSTWDQPGVDVYPVYVCELNGDCPMAPSTTTAFARSWASNLVWPSGEGPALTAQDMQNILQMDPYWNCTYQSPVNDTTDCAEPPDPNRYTQATSTSFFYRQPVPGIGPNTTPYTWAYTNTDTGGLTYTKENDQTWSSETSFGFSIFGLGFKDTISDSTTIKHIYETSSQFTSSSTSTAQASITEPACNVVNGACDPVYPPLNAFSPIPCTPLQLSTAFGQGDNMYIYQDNLFGTFLLEPYGQP